MYIRGWGRLRRRLPQRFELRHAAVFLAGLVTMLLALASPVDALTHRWLSAHMVQHLLLMVVVPPMLWMGAPVVYDLALDSDLWHHVEHACFLVSALLFWRPVILAWPAQMIWPRWTMVP